MENKSYISPMKVGEIIDKGFRVTPVIFKKLLPFVIAVSVMQALQQAGTFFAIVGGIIAGCLGMYVSMIVGVMAAEYWLGNKIDMQVAKKKVSFSLAFRLIGLSLWIGLISFLGFLLFIIPGLVYLANRILAYYILIIEDTTIEQAIKRSKELMTKESFFKSTGPIMRISAIGILLFVLNAMVGGVLGGSSIVFAKQTGTNIALILIVFIGGIVAMFVKFYGVVCYSGFYFDLLARYEGSDIVQTIANSLSAEEDKN